MARKNGAVGTLRETRGIRRRHGGIADWGAVDADVIRRAISAASFVGGALRFGYSRDGGAYAVGIYGDGEPYTEFIKPSEEPEAFLEDVITFFESVADDQAAARTNGHSHAAPPPGNKA